MRIIVVAVVLLLASAAGARPLAFTPLAPIALAVGDDAGPQAVALADLDGDGITDLVAVDRDDDAIHVLLGVGDGTFHAPVDYPLDGTPTAVAVADVASPFASEQTGDVDGRVDVIVADDDGFAEILLGRGDGSFDPPEQDLSDVLDSLELIGVAVRDLDGNGRLDLVFLDSFDEVYFLCNEAGAFAPCATDYIETDGDTAIAFAAADVDADGRTDVAVLSEDSQDVRVFRGLGGGRFEPAPSYVASAVADPLAQTPAAFAAAALDDVGGEELIAASTGPPASALAVLTYAQSALQVATLAGAGEPRAVAVADLDGDALPDLATIAGAAPALSVARGDGSGGLGAPETPDGSAAIGAGRTLVAGRVDGDPRPDLAIVTDAGDAVLVALNATAAAPTCAGDCDGDGLVAINELITGVTIALGLQPVSQCAAFDTDDSHNVEINELIAAVRNALDGCSG